MIGCRWLLLGLAALATVSHLTVAAPQEGDIQSDDWFDRNPDIDYDDFISEDDLSEDDMNELADEIAEEITTDDDDGFTRGKLGAGLKVVGKGLAKGGKKVGSVMLTAGKKVVKVSGKGVKLAGKGLKKVGKGTGKGLLKFAKGAGKGLKKVGKSVGKGALKAGKKAKQVMTTKGKKIWGSLKDKMNGELGQAGKQLMKRVGKEILEQGVSLAVEALTPMIIEYVMDKTQEGLCSCENTICSCCAQPPGFEKACLVVKVRPVKKIMNAAITYNGEELAKLDITKEEGQGSCTQLSGVARFIQACISPIGIGEFEGGFRGCLNINLEPISLERSMCVDFKGTRKDGTANFVPVAELDDIEMESEDAAEEEDEDEEEE